MIYSAHMFTHFRHRAAGFAELLSTPLPIESYLRLIDPLWSATSIPARVEAVIPETKRAATIVLKPGAKWQGHKAGQWIGVGVDIQGVRHRRCYSITSVPSDKSGRISITVQAIPGGLVSNFLVNNIGFGDIIYLDPPSGEFTLPDREKPNFLFVTGGSGITPVMGMLRTMEAAGEIGDVVLLHHAPNAEESIFSGELSDMARRFSTLIIVEVYTGPGVPSPEHAITNVRLDQLCPDWRTRSAWSCGPAPLLASIEKAWKKEGIEAKLNVERFRPAMTSGVGASQGGRVRFTTSDIETVADGRTPLLEVAESSGLLPASGCRMGICHSCDCRLVSGTVRDIRDGRIQSDPGDRVQICVSVAAGDVELEV
ncbi:MAG TPA: ferredoxin reductase [Acidimicrobiales bacterium]|nr:ferredoxin reductase [Acidimicrobiales bacterium]